MIVPFFFFYIFVFLSKRLSLFSCQSIWSHGQQVSMWKTGWGKQVKYGSLVHLGNSWGRSKAEISHFLTLIFLFICFHLPDSCFLVLKVFSCIKYIIIDLVTISFVFSIVKQLKAADHLKQSNGTIQMLFIILTLLLCKTFVVKVLMYSQSHPHTHRRELKCQKTFYDIGWCTLCWILLDMNVLVSSALETEDCAKMYCGFEKYSNIWLIKKTLFSHTIPLFVLSCLCSSQS